MHQQQNIRPYFQGEQLNVYCLTGPTAERRRRKPSLNIPPVTELSGHYDPFPFSSLTSILLPCVLMGFHTYLVQLSSQGQKSSQRKNPIMDVLPVFALLNSLLYACTFNVCQGQCGF